MEPKQIKNILIPAVALAALIALAGLVIVMGGGDEEKKQHGGHDHTTGGKRSKAGDDGTADMAATVPPQDGPGWKDLERGLRVNDVKEGTIDEVCPADATVTIHYTGWLLNGTKFDSSVGKGAPATFPLKSLIAAWQMAIPGMKPGGVRQLLVPAALGYGATGHPPDIPGGATLVFEVKLISWSL